MFEIADDEKLIGCELDEITVEYKNEPSNWFGGVTWIKIKMF